MQEGAPPRLQQPIGVPVGEDALFNLLRVIAREVGDVQVSRLWIEQAVQDEVERFATLPAARPAVAFVGAEFLLPYER